MRIIKFWDLVCLILEMLQYSQCFCSPGLCSHRIRPPPEWGLCVEIYHCAGRNLLVLPSRTPAQDHHELQNGGLARLPSDQKILSFYWLKPSWRIELCYLDPNWCKQNIVLDEVIFLSFQFLYNILILPLWNTKYSGKNAKQVPASQMIFWLNFVFDGNCPHYSLKKHSCLTMWKVMLYHTWVWNPGICRSVIMHPWSHMLIVRRKIVPTTAMKYFTFYPSALRAGGVLSSRSGQAGGWAGGRLPDLRNPYLCNRLTDFLHSKFCGIVWACSCALSWPFAPYGLADWPKTCEICHKLGSDFAERISLKLLDGFAPFKVHDDVIRWKHFPRYWPFVWGINRSPVNSPHKGQWRGALMFSLICTRIKVE